MTATRRMRVAVDLMVPVAATVGGHITRGFLSYRSHAEAYLMSSPEPARAQARFDERSAAAAPLLDSEALRLDGTATRPIADRPGRNLTEHSACHR